MDRPTAVARVSPALASHDSFARTTTPSGPRRQSPAVVASNITSKRSSARTRRLPRGRNAESPIPGYAPLSAACQKRRKKRAALLAADAVRGQPLTPAVGGPSRTRRGVVAPGPTLDHPSTRGCPAYGRTDDCEPAVRMYANPVDASSPGPSVGSILARREQRLVSPVPLCADPAPPPRAARYVWLERLTVRTRLAVTAVSPVVIMLAVALLAHATVTPLVATTDRFDAVTLPRPKSHSSVPTIFGS